jgi:sec-independent protein translocase protein TatA
MGELKPWHFIILAVVLFVLFGYKKLPDATRSLGRSLRILKTEVKSLHEEEQEKAAEQDAHAEAKVTAPRAVEGPRVVTPPRVVQAPRGAAPDTNAPPARPVTAGVQQSADADQR